MTTITLDNSELRRRLEYAAAKLEQPTELTAAISNSFLTVVDDNFESEGRPAWAGLSLVTLAKRKAGKILTQSGRLRNSIQGFHSADEAGVGTNLIYAATQQFGAKQGEFGRTARNGPIPWGDIPARGYMPFRADGSLQTEAEHAVYDDVDHFYQKLF